MSGEGGGGLALRRAVPADAARLALLGGATFLQSFAHDHPGDALTAHVASDHSVAWYAAALAAADAAVWIVETPLLAPIGYAVLATPALVDRIGTGGLELKRIYLLSAWQGGGWGLRMLRAVEDEARRRGANRLLLCVYGPNAGARRFYERYGFRDTGRMQRFMVGTMESFDLVYAKAL